jgi:hypothetical protein
MKTEEELTKAQAEAWCHLVAELMIDFGLDSSEPGEVALKQVQHFLRRKLKPAAQPEKFRIELHECGGKLHAVKPAAQTETTAWKWERGAIARQPVEQPERSEQQIRNAMLAKRGSPEWRKEGATGEWTSVGGDLNTGMTEIFPLGRKRAKTIADAHNAALKAAIKAAVQRTLSNCEGQLTAEREEVRTMTNQCVQLRRELAAEREAAKKVCEIYFNIAAEVIGEDEVRRRRDARLPPAHSPPAEKSSPSE